ncbi:MAG: putative lipid II flippase FtsW [Bdellovibrionales bacterium]|nr:putative lipid II flippase FtsW [Bdellovibrionales bacterium]
MIGRVIAGGFATSRVDGWSPVTVVRSADRWIVLALLILLGMGVLMVYSTTAVLASDDGGSAADYLRRHALHIALGIAVFVLCASIPSEWWARSSSWLLCLGLLSILLVLVPGVGVVAGGARRWLAIGPVRVQPGELFKLIAALYAAGYIARRNERLATFAGGVAAPFAVTGLGIILLLAEPDFGSAAVVGVVVFLQLVAGGVPLRYIAGVTVSGLAGVAAAVLVAPYRMRRFEAFLDPFADPSGSGYQLVQSLIAVGVGGLTGAGLGGGTQKLFYLPAAHTDFIFAVIAEELGFVGCVLVLFSYGLIAFRGLLLALRFEDDPFRSSLAVGMTVLLVLPALLNMGVVTGLLPTKGMVLPLVGYGGTAMLTYMAAAGILVRISTRETR